MPLSRYRCHRLSIPKPPTHIDIETKWRTFPYSRALRFHYITVIVHDCSSSRHLSEYRFATSPLPVLHFRVLGCENRSLVVETALLVTPFRHKVPVRHSPALSICCPYRLCLGFPQSYYACTQQQLLFLFLHTLGKQITWKSSVAVT